MSFVMISVDNRWCYEVMVVTVGRLYMFAGKKRKMLTKAGKIKKC